MKNYILHADSRIGGRNENQDSFAYKETASGLLAVVCDGMGGAQGGKTASELAVDIILSEVENSTFSTPEETLIHAINKANNTIYSKANSTPELKGMGTTVVALLFDEQKATIAHVGDSRVYQMRGKRRVFRTVDHSMVFELVRRGSLTEEQARLAADSNIILRALGTKPEVEIELNTDIPYLKGDRFLLCSDGVCGALSETGMTRLIQADTSVEKTVDIITETIDNIGIKSGGKHDNLTAMLVELQTNSKTKVKMEKKSKTIIAILAVLLLTSLTINILQFNTNQQPIIQVQQEKSKIELLKDSTTGAAPRNKLLEKWENSKYDSTINLR